MLAALTWPVSAPHECGPGPAGEAGPGRAGRAGQGRAEPAGRAEPGASLSPQALGCILYLLCFGQHPFEDGAKLRIVNGKYAIPADDARYSVFHGLIRKSQRGAPRLSTCPERPLLLVLFFTLSFPTCF